MGIKKIFLFLSLPFLNFTITHIFSFSRGWQPGNFLNEIRKFWGYIL
jgi:hypothetical protein